MKKLILMLLVLVGGVGLANATTSTIYVKASSAPQIHVWGDGVTGTVWGNLPTMTEVNVYGVTLYKYDVTYTGDSYSFLFKSTNQSNDVENQSGDVYFSWDGNNSDPSVYDPTISQVELRGSFNEWAENAMSLSDGVYSSTLDLSSTSADQTFKIVVKNGSGDYGWLGWNANTFTLTDAGSLLVAENGNNGDNFKISNKSYKTYNVSVSFTDATTWTMTFAGADARSSETVTVTLKNDANWASANIYTFDNEMTGAWPGTAMTDNGDGTFSYSFNVYEPDTKPDKVIFNNGIDKTDNLYFIDANTYTNKASTKYYVVGNIDEFGEWDQQASTALMTDEDDDKTFTFTASDVVMGADAVSFKIVKKDYVEESDPDWYPSSNVQFNVAIPGKYDIEISFDSDAENLGDASVVSVVPSKTYEAVTITAAGWATTVTNSALDFSETGIKAYTATVADSKVTLTAVTNVQAETGLVLEGAEGTYYIPVIESSETDKGALWFSSTLTYTTWSDAENDNYFYGLALDEKTNKVRFALIDRGGGEVVIPARKAFLMITNPTTSARELDVEFSNGTTGISEVKGAKVAAEGCYNLAGQRVAQPAKGLYIIGGKKVIVK